MSHSVFDDQRQGRTAEPHPLVVSVDGYIRLSFARLQQLPLLHLISGLDEQPPVTHDGATSTLITGYTEWVSDTFPTVTIGWDWLLETRAGRLGLVRVSEPRSNILLQDSQGRDMAPAKSNVMLEALLDSLEWPEIVQAYIKTRYAA